jgi:hypothetical protein
VQEAQQGPLPNDYAQNAENLLESLQQIVRDMEHLSLVPIAPVHELPVEAIEAQDEAIPVQAADLQLEADNQPQAALLPEAHAQREGPAQLKKRRLSRPKGQAPSRCSNRLAGRPAVDHEEPEASEAGIVVVAPIAAPAAAFEPAIVAAPVIAAAPVVVAAPAVVAPEADIAGYAADVDMQDEHDIVEPVEAAEQQEVQAVQALRRLTRQQERRLAATGGWQAFLTELPDEVPEGKLRPRRAAIVCKAKVKYLAVALRPNLCE